MENYSHLESVFKKHLYTELNAEGFNSITKDLLTHYTNEKIELQSSDGFDAVGSYIHLKSRAANKIIYGKIYKISIDNLYPSIINILSLKNKGIKKIIFDPKIYAELYNDILGYRKYLKSVNKESDILMGIKLLTKRYINSLYGMVNSGKGIITTKYDMARSISNYVAEHIKPIIENYDNILAIYTDEIYLVEPKLAIPDHFSISHEQLINRLNKLGFECDIEVFHTAMFERIKRYILIGDERTAVRGYPEFNISQSILN